MDISGQRNNRNTLIHQVVLQSPVHLTVDMLGIEPKASCMLSGCDTTTPHALENKACQYGKQVKRSTQWHVSKSSTCLGGNMHFGNQEGRGGARPSGTDSG